MFRDHGGLTGQREPAPVGVPWACRVRHASSGSRCATRLAPSRWTGTSIVMIKMSVGPPSIDLPPTPQAPCATRRALQSGPRCGWGLATGKVNAAVVAAGVATSAVKHAPRTRCGPGAGLAPGPVGLWVADGGSAPDRGRPRPPAPEAAPACASWRLRPTAGPGRSSPRRTSAWFGLDDHTPPQAGPTWTPTVSVPAESRSRAVGRQEAPDRVSKQQNRQAGGWYADGCTD